MTRFMLQVATILSILVPVSVASATDAAPAVQSGDIVYGSVSAPVEIIEYASLTCPHCAHFSTDVFPEFKKQYIDTGKVRFVFRNFVRDPYDMVASLASRCTGDVEATKTMIAALFAEQQQWIRSPNYYEAVFAIAAKSGVSKEAFAACLDNEDLAKTLVMSKQDGIKLYKIERIPTLVINGVPTVKHELEDLKQLIEGGQ